MAVKKGGYKTGGEGNEGKVTKTSKATAFDSDMYKKDKQKRNMTKDDAYRVNLRKGGRGCKLAMKGKGRAYGKNS